MILLIKYKFNIDYTIQYIQQHRENWWTALSPSNKMKDQPAKELKSD